MFTRPRLPLAAASLLLCGALFLCPAPADGQAGGSVIVEPARPGPDGPRRIVLQILSDDIVHVAAAPDDAGAPRPSLIVERTAWPPVPVSRTEAGDDVVLRTRTLQVTVSRRTGRVAFRDAAGRLLLREAAGGATLVPDTVMGEPTHRAQELFESPDGESFYGLGQHQNGILDYKGHAVDLWQKNAVIAVPFLVSSRNYGILWDNTSHSHFGDPRAYRPLSGFRLQDGQGQAGGLTAEYFADRSFARPLVTRTESAIDHEYDDRPTPYPPGFDPNRGSVRWSGALEAAESGTYHLRLYSSSYVKLWLDDRLVVDTWRQNWHPWTDFADVPLKAGERLPIRLEWVPDGGYIGLRALPPEPARTAGRLALTSDVADRIDYYFVRGDDLDGVIHGYRELTGRAPMVPRWALGLWQSRERYQTQDSVLSVVRAFRERRIPLDDIVQDWFYWPENAWGSHDFDPARYPDPRAMVDTLHRELHSHIMISVWPKFYVGIENYRQLADSGFLYLRMVRDSVRDWVGHGYVHTFYDAFNPGARRLYFEQWSRKLVPDGFDAWWMDAPEPDVGNSLSPAERLARIGPTFLGSAARVENAYTLEHARGTYEGLRRLQPNRRVFILTRSAYAGQQRYATAVWSGDVASRWEALAAQIPAGLDFSLSGIPYWTTDIGGFAPEQRFVRPDSADLEEWRELMTRWFQFGTFCPLLRVHGQFPYRELFNVAPADHPAYQAMLAADRLRYRLMPYLYSLAGMVTHDDYTIMRALVMDFEQDARARAIPDEYMFGPALLVAPVTRYHARSRPVYLPAGTGWYDLADGRHLDGGRTIEAQAPYDRIPLFAREGAILPVGPEIQYTDEKPADPVRLYIYTGRDGHFSLYEDQDTTYDYEHGAFATIPFDWDQARQTLTIGARQGEFPGMLRQRTFEIVRVTPDHPATLDPARPPERTVRYDGRALTVQLDGS